MNKTTTALAAGLALGIGIVALSTIATPQEAKTKFRELAPNIATHRVDLTVSEAGVVTAAIHQHGVLTADAVAAGVQPVSWVVDGVACNATPVLNVINAQCPILDVSKVPFAFQP